MGNVGRRENLMDWESLMTEGPRLLVFVLHDRSKLEHYYG